MNFANMDFAEKLIVLRKKAGLSQEQLADRLGVTRQSVSKWESGMTLPELGKIIVISEMFNVSVDYLVKGNAGEPLQGEAAGLKEAAIEEHLAKIERYFCGFEYVSKTKIGGIPLVCVRFNPNRNYVVAKGIIAIGNVAVGVFAVGGISLGVIGIGGIGIGALAVGGVALGGFALGAAAVGIVALGASALGIYAGGVAAMGREIAVGISASSNKTAVGIEWDALHGLKCEAGLTGETVQAFLLQYHPKLWKPLLKLLAWIASVVA